jgi:hypothetical protein
MRSAKVLLVGIACVVPMISTAGRQPTAAQSAFGKLQSLAGDWEGKDGEGMPAKTNFKVIAANTAVMETISPMHMEEMVTLYSLDGNSIALIHYCPTNNQPHMEATPATANPRELVFEFKSVANLASPGAGHQHKLVMQFEDVDHITENWTWRAKGKDTPMVFHFTRKKK